MSRLISNKLQAQRNFQSVWHSPSFLLSTLLREDQIIRKYIKATMKSYQWKVSKIIIKRKVNSLHIAFQTQYYKYRKKKRFFKNRLKNRLKYFKRKKLSKKKHPRNRLLFYLIFVLTRTLKKFYPNNLITFYIQRVYPLHLNTELIQEWILYHVKKKKSYKRLIYRVIKYFSHSVEHRIQLKSSNVRTIWDKLGWQSKQTLISWLSINFIYLYQQNLLWTSVQDPNKFKIKLDLQQKVLTKMPYNWRSNFKNKISSKWWDQVKPQSFIKKSPYKALNDKRSFVRQSDKLTSKNEKFKS